MLDGCAALLIYHRFSSVRLADGIYVLDDSRVRECGSHDELMNRGQHYAELFGLQSTAYQRSLHISAVTTEVRRVWRRVVGPGGVGVRSGCGIANPIKVGGHRTSQFDKDLSIDEK